MGHARVAEFLARSRSSSGVPRHIHWSKSPSNCQERFRRPLLLSQVSSTGGAPIRMFLSVLYGVTANFIVPRPRNRQAAPGSAISSTGRGQRLGERLALAHLLRARLSHGGDYFVVDVPQVITSELPSRRRADSELSTGDRLSDLARRRRPRSRSKPPLRAASEAPALRPGDHRQAARRCRAGVCGVGCLRCSRWSKWRNSNLDDSEKRDGRDAAWIGVSAGGYFPRQEE